MRKILTNVHIFEIYQQINIVFKTLTILKDMNYLDNKTILIFLAFLGAALTMPTDQKFSLDIPQEQIIGSDSSATGHILAIVTKTKELRVYKLYKEVYELTQKLSTCSSSSVRISESNDFSFVVSVNCKNISPQIYHFNSQFKLAHRITNLNKNMGQNSNEDLKQVRVLQSDVEANDTCNGTCANDTICENGTCVVAAATTSSPALPLAVGVPLAALGVAGLIAAKVVIAAQGAATGASYLVQEPARAIQVEETAKMVNIL